jgi:3-deoxy-7-phosphoheptulonate synthase
MMPGTMASGAMDWAPDSWRKKATAQQPTYPDETKLESVLSELGRLPPLVTSWEIEDLRERLARAARGWLKTMSRSFLTVSPLSSDWGVRRE